MSVRSVLCTKFFFAVLAVSVGSGFQHGYHTGIINIPAEVLQNWIKSIKRDKAPNDTASDDDVMLIWSTTVAIFSVGGVMGAFLISFLAERFGRKNSLLLNNFIILIAIICLASSKNAESFELFIFGRFLAGVNAGLNGGLCQIYLIEITPDAIRGTVGSVYQIVIIISIMFAQLAGVAFGSEDYWHVMFILPLIPAIFQTVTLPFCPETPKFLLISRDREKQAEKALIWLRNTPDVHEEMELLEEEDNLVKQLHAANLKRLLSNSGMRYFLISCLALNVAQQLCGINIVIYYSVETFKDVGLDRNVAVASTIGISFILILATLVEIYFVDHVGRRFLLMVSFLGMALDTVFMFLTFTLKDKGVYLKYLSIIFILIFIACFSIGVGPIAWFITAEMFAHETRSLAVCVTVAGNWIANFIVGQAYLPLKAEMGFYIFIVFFIIDGFFYLFTIQYVPESKNKSAKQIIEMYK